MTDLGSLRISDYCYALGINNNGQVVGFSGGSAFLYSGGAMIDLNTLIPTNSGWTLEEATGINDSGQICGYGRNPSGQDDAFLLTPVPEPATWGLFVLGSIVFVLHRRR
jgi:probable HAF family extracellular repeat protein